MNETIRSAAILLSILLATGLASGQAVRRDEASYRDNVLLDREKAEEEARDRALAEKRGVPYKAEDKKPEKALTLDLSGLERPRDPREFKGAWHFPPQRQWWTNTCWCFSGTSFLESEIRRVRGKEIKLSEMFTVYWEFVEKVREFVRTRGASLVDEGSQHEAVLRRWKEYGIVRGSDYTGTVGGATVPNHGPLIEEIRAYLDFLRKVGSWDEASAIAGLRVILDRHLGRPPEKIAVDGREMTPREFFRDSIGLNLDDYVLVESFLYAPFWTKAEYEVPDNWWHGKEYLNVPLDDWYGAFRKAVQDGFTVGLAGDVSEPGYDGQEDVAIVPSFDIPEAAIDQSAREFRFANHTTQDDHGIHVVGFLRKGDRDWYLVKDSSRSGQRGVPGYYFYREDYVKLKMLTFIVHKDGVRPLREKFEKRSAPPGTGAK
jgi:bleomycin hydrolase